MFRSKLALYLFTTLHAASTAVMNAVVDHKYGSIGIVLDTPVLLVSFMLILIWAIYLDD